VTRGVGEHPLFRTLVVYGASLVSLSCGGRASPDDEARAGAAGSGGAGSGTAGSAGVGGAGVSGGGHAGAAGTLVCPQSCVAFAEYVCDDYQAGLGCHCDPGAPSSFRECEVRWDFQCTSSVSPAACGGIISIGNSFGCGCVRSLRPEDCEQPWHFQCDTYYPMGTLCECDPNAPSKPEDCPPPATLICEQKEPPAACHCVESIPIK